MNFLYFGLLFCFLYEAYVGTLDVEFSLKWENYIAEVTPPSSKFKMLQYSVIHLNSIRYRMKTDASSFKISPITFEKLRSSGLLKKRRSRRGGARVKKRGANINNLIRITPTFDQCNYKEEKFMNFGVLNCQSIRNKAASINDLISTNDLDFCLLTETWLGVADDVIRTAATPVDYIFLDSVRNTRGGGTGLLCKQIYKPKLVEKKQFVTFESSEYKITNFSAIIHIIVVYRAPYSIQNHHTIPAFINEFENYIDTFVTSSNKIIVGGDFNIHVDNLNDNCSKRFIDLLSSYDLINSINFPTHVKGHSLDLVLTRFTDSLNPVSTPLSFPSDHCLIKTTIDISRPLKTIEQISFRPLKKIDLQKFKDQILQSDLFSCNLDNLDVNEIVNKYNSTLQNLLNKHAPMKTINIRKKDNSPWYSDSLRNLKKTKRYFEDKWLKSQSNQCLIEFKIIKNQYIKECNSMKTRYYSNKITECGNDSRQIYKIINSLCQGNTTLQYPDEINNQVLCNKFNEFFSNKVQNIVTEIDHIILNENLQPNIQYSTDNSLIPFHNFTPFSNNQVDEIIKKMNKKNIKIRSTPSFNFK